MALAPPRLDDLTWQGMLEAVRRRIPARSAGNWTLHAPVDPGVTLLELYAWLLDQRVYMLDQTTDALVLAELGLLDLAPAPTSLAATVLVANPDAVATIPRGAQARLAGREPPLIFSAARRTTLLPMRGNGERAPVRLLVAGADRTTDLGHGRLVRLFPADGSAAPPDVTFLLPLSAPPPASASAPLALLLQLDTPASVGPSWSGGVPAIAPPARLSWWYPATGGDLVRFAHVEDGTGGLRRSGVVRLAVPTDWVADTIDGAPSYAIVLRAERATWAAPPRLAAVDANAVAVRHEWRTAWFPLTRAWLPIPGNTLALGQLPEADPEKAFPPLELGLHLRLRERDLRWHRWRIAHDLARHGPTERVFTLDRESGTIAFGDGYTGRQPTLASDGATNVLLRYWVGGGPDGNVAVAREWALERPAGAPIAALNVVAATGGDDAQSPGDARAAAAGWRTEVTRAVTADDYETLARTTPGAAVRRAHAALGVHPAHPCRVVPGAVTVFVVPDVPRDDPWSAAWRDDAFVAAPAPDPGVLAAVAARLQEARLVTTEVFVSPVRYRPVGLAIDVSADVDDAATLRDTLAVAMRTFLDPLLGVSDDAERAGTGWPFGERIRPSTLLRRAQDSVASGIEVTAVTIGIDGAEPTEACLDVAIGEHELPYLAAFALRLRAPIAARAGLR